MSAQRWILTAAVVLGIGYAWLSGAFAGLGSSSEPAQATAEIATPPAVTPTGPVVTQPVVAAPAEPSAPVEPAPAASEGSAGAKGSQAAPAQSSRAIATFAAGCFWCTEADFDK